MKSAKLHLAFDVLSIKCLNMYVNFNKVVVKIAHVKIFQNTIKNFVFQNFNIWHSIYSKVLDVY